MGANGPLGAVIFETLPYEHCVDEVREFRNSQREVARDAGYFAWRYAEKPCNEPAYVTWGRTASGSPIACASAIPHDFHIIDRRAPAAVVGDIAVIASYRGRGVARTLLEELRRAAMDRGLSGCFVLPNSDVSGPLARAGWTHVGAISRFVRPLFTKDRLGRRFGAPGRAVGAFMDVALRAQAAAESRHASPAHTGSTSAEFGHSYDELWERLPKSGRILAVRDRANLNWRFAAKPGESYAIFELRRRDGLAGYVVHRQEGDILNVEDFLALDDAAAMALSAEFVRFARAERRASTLQARFNRETALPVPWRSRAFIKRPDFQSLMWAGLPPTTALLPSASWFVTPGDKDV